MSVLAPRWLRSVHVVAFSVGNKVWVIMELCSLIPHPVVLAGGGLGIFSGLGDVLNIEIVKKT